MAAIAHEVRQPLTAIVINGSAARRFLARAPADIDEATANLNRIINDCRRASEVFDSILALFRREDQERQAIDVNEIALEVLQSSRGELAEHRVTTRTELASELPLISGHKRQLQQVISNLVQNAIEAMDNTTDRGRFLRVRTGLHNRDAIIVEQWSAVPSCGALHRAGAYAVQELVSRLIRAARTIGDIEFEFDGTIQARRVERSRPCPATHPPCALQRNLPYCAAVASVPSDLRELGNCLDAPLLRGNLETYYKD